MRSDVARLIGRWLAGYLCLLCMATTALAQNFEVEVGGRVVSVPIPPDHVRVGETAPDLFRALDATTPPAKRLIEVLATEADVARMRGGVLAEDHLFYVYEELRWAGREPPPREWQDLRARLRHATQRLDASQATDLVEDALNESVERKFDGRYRFDVGAIGQPVLYRDDDNSIRLFARIGVSASAGDRTLSGDMLIFAATVPLNGRMLFFNGACICAKDAASAETLGAAFDDLIDRAIAGNAPQPARP